MLVLVFACCYFVETSTGTYGTRHFPVAAYLPPHHDYWPRTRLVTRVEYVRDFVLWSWYLCIVVMLVSTPVFFFLLSPICYKCDRSFDSMDKVNHDNCVRERVVKRYKFLSAQTRWLDRLKSPTVLTWFNLYLYSTSFDTGRE